MKRRIDLLEMVKKISKKNKTTRDVGAAVDDSILLHSVTGTQTNANAFEQIRKSPAQSPLDDKTAVDACYAVINEVIQCKSQTKALTDRRTDIENADLASVPKRIIGRPAQDVTRDQSEEIVKDIIGNVLSAESLKINKELAVGEIQAVDKQSEEIVNCVLETVVRSLQNSACNSEISCKISNTNAVNKRSRTTVIGTMSEFIDHQPNHSQACGTSVKGDAQSGICAQCGKGCRCTVSGDTGTNGILHGGFNASHNATKQSTGVIMVEVDNMPRTNMDHSACADKIMLDFFKADNNNSKTPETLIVSPEVSSPCKDKSVQVAKRTSDAVNCVIDNEDGTLCKAGSSEACTQTELCDHRPFRSEGRLRSLICCRR